MIDSGSTDHVIVQKSWFENLRELDTSVTNPDGGNTKVLGIGEVEVLARDAQGREKLLVLRKALFVPGYRTDLISVSSVIYNGHKIVHHKTQSFLCLKSKETIPIERKGKLFFIRTIPKHGYHIANLSGGPNQSELWHKRFGNLNCRDLKQTVPIELKNADEKCETCCVAKIVKTPVPNRTENKATKVLERVYADVFGPITPSSVDGYQYFVVY